MLMLATLTKAMHKDKSKVRLLFVLCMLSGLASLVYEVVLLRLNMRLFGSTLAASATVLSAFMAGLAIGAQIAGSKLDDSRDPLLIYIWLELSIAASGLLLVHLYSQPALAEIWSNLQAGGCPAMITRFAASFLLVGICSSFMGATLPVLSRSVELYGQKAIESAGGLYLVNTAGAVLGTILTAFWFVPSLGLNGAVATAFVLNLAIAWAAGWLRHGKQPPISKDAPASGMGRTAILPEREACIDRPPPITSPEREVEPPAMIFAIVFLSGAISMILEVAWTRFFALTLGSSTYAFSTMLALFLTGLAVGTWLSLRFLYRLPSPRKAMSGLFLSSAACVCLALICAPELPRTFLLLEQCFSAAAGAFSFGGALAARLLVSAAFVLPPATMLGAAFALSLKMLLASTGKRAAGLGVLYAFNLSGAILGAILAGFVLIPWLSDCLGSGLQFTLLLSACLQFLLAGLLCRRRSGLPQALKAGVWLLAIVLLLSGSAVPWSPALMSSGCSFYSGALLSRQAFLEHLQAASGSSSRILFYREGLNTTVTVGEVFKPNITYLKNDGKMEASVPTNPLAPAPDSDYATQLLLGDLPLLLHKGTVRRALVIGLGSGTTAGAMLQSPKLTRMTVAEIEPAVVKAQSLFVRANHDPLGKNWRKRVSLVPEDGRYLLSVDRSKFDAIVSQPAEPWVNGAGDLFTLEFWRLARSRLADDGVFCQWIQLYGITPRYLAVLCRTFERIFPETVVFHPYRAGELILIGFNGPAKPGWQSIRPRLDEPDLRQDLIRAGIRQLPDLAGMIAMTPAELGSFCNEIGCRTDDHRLNTDDNLLLEYQLPKEFRNMDKLMAENLNAIPPPSFNRLDLFDGKRQ